ncbi:hypothetical protein IAG25_34610 [Caballeronia sp. EK]|uniref:hypothetical protein n=1 Tax=Caballeronia sp. EK TaxID=2767469 RepID=UPI001656336F|nr:hypothetical protein [Caballeronia sp. EK]MBC8641963.1 hypothetical protein [Caballeronia sp. EK]
MSLPLEMQAPTLARTLNAGGRRTKDGRAISVKLGKWIKGLPKPQLRMDFEYLLGVGEHFSIVGQGLLLNALAGCIETLLVERRSEIVDRLRSSVEQLGALARNIELRPDAMRLLAFARLAVPIKRKQPSHLDLHWPFKERPDWRA